MKYFIADLLLGEPLLCRHRRLGNPRPTDWSPKEGVRYTVAATEVRWRGKR